MSIIVTLLVLGIVLLVDILMFAVAGLVVNIPKLTVTVATIPRLTVTVLDVDSPRLTVTVLDVDIPRLTMTFLLISPDLL